MANNNIIMMMIVIFIMILCYVNYNYSDDDYCHYFTIIIS